MGDKHSSEQSSLNTMFGTYADVLFVLFPFLVIFMQRLWVGELEDVLLRPDLSIAAAILGGLAIGKFVLGLVVNRELGAHKERIVFFIALTLFLVLGPSIIMILSLVGSSDVPGFVAFLQPVLLIVSISLYTTAISISNMLSRSRGASEAMDVDENHDPQAASKPTALVIPRRTSGS
ncbi:MAG: hypothetical protein CL581_11540 [Alteromonadaceae bacterium]|uniref:hypothetical protein n=1 Tax=unclassified Marinobacter TaxID=83889 RepID=UPI000C405AAC|nr:hypothetical protein [Marinobacter sp. BGYM27]MAA65398.1 hypothetical protein [Alteromonadaceae bacterium]MBH85064.1 hypothetical protein [Alteromonadaceae bacterium]MDG5500143.1 hypothetical protein [Marinobacter sp. BGYM27]|tara:strand:- start:39300 stop:39830 length:531 start_codon:yes stop_codon:yes gene_type:complete